MQPVIRCWRDRNARGWNDIGPRRGGGADEHQLARRGECGERRAPSPPARRRPRRRSRPDRSGRPGSSASVAPRATGELAGGRVGIDRDDPRRACQARADDDVQPDPAAPRTPRRSRPRATPAVHSAAPTPVTTAQPTSAASSGGTSAQLADRTGRRQDDVLAEAPRRSASPRSARRRGTSAARRARRPPRTGAARRAGSGGSARTAPSSRRAPGSPGASPSTPSPTDSISPAPSWPSRIGVNRASRTCETSVWQSPAARIRTRTSPGPGGSTVSSWSAAASSPSALVRH